MFTLERFTHESKYQEKYVRECEIPNGDYSLHDLARDLKVDVRNCAFKVNDNLISNDSIQNNINEDDLIQAYILPIDYMFFLPTLKIFSDGLKHPRQEIFSKNADFFNFPQDILEKRTSGGRNFSHEVKTERAITRLKRFGMIELDNEGYYITEKGLSLLNENNEELTRDEIEEYEIINFNENYVGKHRNLIYFGAPGTGKSFNLEKDRKDLLQEEFKENYERVTFHPDYSYANFVGSYKPVMNDDEISYEYVPGPFMRSLVKAYNNPHEPFILIIEEINRANVAAVFGDVFQLLDRDEDNVSRYPIQTSVEMRKYLKKELTEWSYVDDVSSIKIPSNLFIWATMNSADQGVFPMDTAFKRRWNFKYFGINHDFDKISKLKSEGIYWNDVREAINEMLLSEKINEDKLLGPFFAFSKYVPSDETINEDVEIPKLEFDEIFKNKVIMYLFEDVAKSMRNDLFKGAKGNDKSYVTYSEICDKFDEIRFGIFNPKISDILRNNNE